MIVADTDVLIDYLQGRGPADARIALELERGLLATTTVSRFELLAGVRSSRQRRLVVQLLTALPALPVDAEAADRAAKVRRQFDETGETIAMGDSLIAGIVLARKGILLTAHVRRFDRVTDLSLVSLPE